LFPASVRRKRVAADDLDAFDLAYDRDDDRQFDLLTA
jgi:hypothetical protein